MKHLKLFLMFCLSLAMCYSPIAKSQNSGPNAPEAMQFEPVDATDMVNLVTGDVSYVLPLLSIPSPEGDFPIAINYHAGIAMDQEASWVGLGWNLNVGAINRSVMGIADDMNGSVSLLTHFDYIGKDINNYISVSVPINGISVGVNVSWGSSWSVGGSVGLTNGLGIGMSAGSEGVGFSLGYQANGIGGSVSSGPSGWGVGLGYSSAIADMDVSFSSHGVGVSGRIGFIVMPGFSSESSGNTYTNYSDWHVYALFIKFGHIIARHFFFQKEIKNNYGVIYFSNNNLDSDKDYHSEGVQTTKNIADVLVYPYNFIDYADNDQIEKSSQLMLPAYDSYVVNAQGLNGTISPRFFKPGLIYGNGRSVASGLPDIDYDYDNGLYEDDHLIKEEIFYANNLSDLPKISGISSNIYFYFNNLSESYLKIREGNFTSHSGDIIWGNTDFSGGQLETSNNYNTNKHRKVNSNFVEYFTNKEIRDNKAGILKRGFLETESINDGTQNPRSNITLFDPDGIGAFSIVASDGKTYHFSLPVYEFETFFAKDLPNDSYYEQISTGKYAYTWLLTAITGPDFIDRPNDSDILGTVGDEDYGFWIKFEYGKWTDGYIWQLPFAKRNNEAYSWGRKQIYYLNSIVSRTHTAYFIKSLRNDGLGIRKDLPQTSAFEYKGHIAGYFNLTDCNGQSINYPGIYIEDLKLTRTINCNYNHKVLKLDKIVLVKNSDLNLSTENSSDMVTGAPLGNYSINYQENFHLYTITNSEIGVFCKPDLINSAFKIYYQDNILDEKDNVGLNIESKALKIIDFKYDYQLATNSPNSMPENNKGRLTLRSINERRLNGHALMPPYTFNYYNSNNYDTNQQDEWGFNRIYPENWSLKEIVTPLGSKISLEYESDSYLKETSTNQSPYYVFNGYDLEVTLLEYNSTTGAKLQVDVPYLNYIDKTTFFNDVTSYKGYVDFTVSYINPGPPMDIKRVEERLRDIPVTMLSANPTSCRFIFYYKSNYMSNWPHFVFDKINIAIKITKPGELRAGGLRAKRIIVNGSDIDQITEYYYNKPSTTITSGVTTYSPHQGMFVPYIYEQYSPAVFYEYVTVRNKTQDDIIDRETLYNFEIPSTSSDPNNISYSAGNQIVVQNDPQFISGNSFTEDPNPNDDDDISAFARSSLISNNTAAIGRLLNVKTMNHTGQVINETAYSYKPISNSMQGSVQETFYYLKNFKTWRRGHISSISKYQYVSTSKVEYPSILDNIVSISNGLKTTTYYDSYDINTGKATSVRTILPDGKEYKSVVVPAYTISSYAGGTADNASSIGMGSKVWNIYNKNMLSQEAASFNLLNTNTSASPIWKAIGTGIQTWNSNWNIIAGTGVENQTGVWRKHKTFAWKGNIDSDGTYNSSYFNTGGRYSPGSIASYWSDFGGEGVNGWQKTSEVITYNKYSLPIQTKDINNNYYSKLTSKEDEYVIAEAAYARCTEIAYSGAEESVETGAFMGGNTTNYAGTVSTLYAHTGKNSLLVSSGNIGFISSIQYLPARKYKISVWVKGTTSDYGKIKLLYALDDGVVHEIAGENKKFFQSGDWFLVTGDVLLPGTGQAYFYCEPNGGSIYMDDFRVQPVDAAVTAYVYDARDNVSAILDNDNMAVKYEYDEGDRLIATYKETPKGFEKVSGNDYNFSRCSCAAGFSWTPVTLATNDRNVSFASFDNSSNCTYNWSFGDGTANSTLKNPSHTFSIPSSMSNGYYDVTCTVTDSKGKTAAESNKVYFAFAKIASPNGGSTITKGTTTLRIYTALPGTYVVEQIRSGENSMLSYSSFSTTQYETTTEISTDWMYLSDPPYSSCLRIRFQDGSLSSEYCGYNVVN